MSKYCVKKPFTALVAVIMILVLGVVSFTGMNTDLLPAMELPYVMVVTSYPGASPEKVEAAVTAPLEAALGTVNGVVTVSSSSGENVSMVSLEFENGTNMDSAMVKLSTAVDQVKGFLPDTAQSPMIMQLSPDMLPVMIASIHMDDTDLFELSDFAEKNVIPTLERQAGVANVGPTGLVQQSIEIKLDEAKIDEINTKVLANVDSKLADAKSDLTEAQQAVADGRTELENGKNSLKTEQENATSELADASAQLDSAVAAAQSLANQKTGLEASKAALEGEKKAIQDNLPKLEEGIQQLDGTIGSLKNLKTTVLPSLAPSLIPSIGDETKIDDLLTALNAVIQAQPDLAQIIASLDALKLQGATTVGEIETVVIKSLNEEKAKLEETKDQLSTRITQIDAELANLNTQLIAANAMAEQAQKGLETAQEAYSKLEAGKMQAAAGFGAGSAQMAAAESALKESEAQLESATEQFNTAREEALKNADMSKLLTKELVSNLIMAQNLAMPAGYLYQDDDQYLLKIGEGISDLDQLGNTLLLNMDGVGDVRIQDVAQITMIDNVGDSYAKVNGSPAVAVSIQKGSTASTSAVSKELNAAIEDLEKKYPGLHITSLMDQGDYIKMTVDTVLSNLGWGAVLAVFVLALFLKDLRPTAVVALSIPISLMFAIVLMYFSNVTLNMISLSGLALGVGMLVDNSIVVMENIYRLRGEGMSAAKAAVKGAKQVAGAIAASTLTTICVFLPILFTTGITRQLFVDMGLTIAYSLVASLLVALTVVPALGSTLLRTAKEKPHRWFDAMVSLYDKSLNFCLKFKIVPLSLAIGLLVLCVWHTGKMGMEFMPSMGGNQMSATLTLPEDISKEEAFETADHAMELIGQIDGIETIGAMDSGSMMGGMMAGNSDQIEGFSYYILLDEESSKDNKVVADSIMELESQLPGCTLSVMTSNMDMSMLGGSGMALTIRGRDLDKLNEISLDMIDLLGSVEGFEPATNGQEEGTDQLRLVIDKDQAMRYGLTVAQIYGDLSEALKDSIDSSELAFEHGEFQVTVVDERNSISRDNLLDYEFEVSTTDEDGKSVTETHKLGEFASLKGDISIASISRENQQRYMTVSAQTKNGYNTVLLSREVEKLLNDYQVPEGYTVEIAGETETIAQAMMDLIKMILLAVTFIYLIMVAQFQSLLSPFIVMFTMPLAFTGGLGALWIAGEPLSVISMLGFLILAGIVVNNGIVFVDYTNQLRLAGYGKREALLLAGKARIRPILMTAMTTILAMSVMVFSKGMGAEMSRPMALVTIGGLAYATLLTLYIVPVLYEMLFRRQLKKVDVGDEDDEASAAV